MTAIEIPEAQRRWLEKLIASQNKKFIKENKKEKAYNGLNNI